MKYIQIGKRVVPLWILGVGLAGLTLASYMLLTVIIPFEVREPLEILYYPSKLGLYPGETEYFNVTVQNHASRSYDVFLDFSLDNATYEDKYVSFSNETYIMHPGIQNLTAWLNVSADAPAIDATLQVDFYRMERLLTEFPTEQLKVQGVTFLDDIDPGSATVPGVRLSVQNTGTANLTTSRYKIGTNGTPTDLDPEVLIAQGATENVDVPLSWSSGSTYDIYLITATGKQFPYRATAP